MTETDLKIIAAIASAVAAIVVAVLSALFGYLATRANQRELERLKAQLLEEKGESDAKRAYTYDALKRLYAQYEPIRFHLVEAIEGALGTIHELAELAKSRETEFVGAFPKGSYLRAARVYQLLLPAVYFKIMQSQLTLVDLGASRPSYLQYLLAKQANLVLCCDRETAAGFGLTYTPYVTGWRELRQGNPQRYRRQGFAIGRYDNAVSALLPAPEDKPQRIMAFSEFESLAKEVPLDDCSSPFGAALDLFDDFSPETRPVLWRGLLLQFCLYNLFVYAARSGVSQFSQVEARLPTLRSSLLELGASDELTAKVVEVLSSGPLAHVRASHGDA